MGKIKGKNLVYKLTNLVLLFPDWDLLGLKFHDQILESGLHQWSPNKWRIGQYFEFYIFDLVQQNKRNIEPARKDGVLNGRKSLSNSQLLSLNQQLEADLFISAPHLLFTVEADLMNIDTKALPTIEGFMPVIPLHRGYNQCVRILVLIKDTIFNKVTIRNDLMSNFVSFCVVRFTHGKPQD